MKNVGRAATAVLGMALMTGACSTTTHVGSAFSPEAARQIRRKEGSVPIEILDPEAPRSMHLADRVVNVAPDATVVRRPDGSDLTIRNETIRRVRARNRALGAGEGALLGGVTAAAMGVIGVGYGVRGTDPYLFSNQEVVVFSGILLGATGAALGALFGALAGHTTTYVFDDGR
jgi:hypothetical protein